MSSNQRPTGVRIIKSQGNGPNLGRRRGDRKVDAPATGLTAEEQKEIAALRRERAEKEMLERSAQESRHGRLRLVMLFLIGCALGGTLVSFFNIGGQP